MTQTFSVVTTWGDQHWDHHAKRSVQSILSHWPEQVTKFFYPDNLTQQMAYCLIMNLHYVAKNLLQGKLLMVLQKLNLVYKKQ